MDTYGNPFTTCGMGKESRGQKSLAPQAIAYFGADAIPGPPPAPHYQMASKGGKTSECRRMTFPDIIGQASGKYKECATRNALKETINSIRKSMKSARKAD